MALAGLAWLPLLLGPGWKRRTQSAAAIPAVVSLLLAARCARVSVRTVASSPEGDTFFWLLLSIELAALIAAVMVWHQEEKLIGGPLARLVLSAGAAAPSDWATSNFDYGMMTVFSEAD